MPEKTTDPTTSAAEIVRKGKSEREINLEKKVSGLEDKITFLEGRDKEFTKLFEAAKVLPSVTQPDNTNRTVLDDLADFWGIK